MLENKALLSIAPHDIIQGDRSTAVHLLFPGDLLLLMLVFDSPPQRPRWLALRTGSEDARLMSGVRYPLPLPLLPPTESLSLGTSSDLRSEMLALALRELMLSLLRLPHRPLGGAEVSSTANERWLWLRPRPWPRKGARRGSHR